MHTHAGMGVHMRADKYSKEHALRGDDLTDTEARCTGAACSSSPDAREQGVPSLPRPGVLPPRPGVMPPPRPGVPHGAPTKEGRENSPRE